MKLFDIDITHEDEHEIKVSNKGEFTEWCKENGFKSVTCGCICKGLKNDDPKIRRRANFAYNFGFKRNGHICKCVEELRKR